MDVSALEFVIGNSICRKECLRLQTRGLRGGKQRVNVNSAVVW